MNWYMALEIVLTEWALQSYLELRHKQAFTDTEYWSTLRPDVERLRSFPDDAKFSVDKFWGPATLPSGAVVPDGFKMKWHNLGSGRVQLRLCVAILGNVAYLCQAFVKSNDSQDKREAAKLDMRIFHIRAGRFDFRGKL
jgi:hypothetical protein